MHFILAKVEDLSIASIQWKNVLFEEGTFIYQLVFENEEKTKGYINWMPHLFPMATYNVIQFTKKEDIYLLETSAASNLNRFKKIIEYVNPNAVVTRFKPDISTQAMQDIFGEKISYLNKHGKGWYMESVIQFEEQSLAFEYSPIDGKGKTSMILSRKFHGEIVEKILDLMLVHA